jgi:hypothetical protein
VTLISIKITDFFDVNMRNLFVINLSEEPAFYFLMVEDGSSRFFK